MLICKDWPCSDIYFLKKLFICSAHKHRLIDIYSFQPSHTECDSKTPLGSWILHSVSSLCDIQTPGQTRVCFLPRNQDSQLRLSHSSESWFVGRKQVLLFPVTYIQRSLPSRTWVKASQIDAVPGAQGGRRECRDTTNKQWKFLTTAECSQYIRKG